MNASNKSYVSGIGMVTAVGLNTAMNEASINAKIRRVLESEYYNNDLNPIIMGLVPDEALPELSYNAAIEERYFAWQKRFLRLGCVAMQEAMQGYTDNTSIPLILACPENYTQCPHNFPNNFIEMLINQSTVNINLIKS